MMESFDWERFLFLSLIVIAIGGVMMLIINRIGHKARENREAAAEAQAAQIPAVVLVACPACAKQVSNYAGACPSCGHPLQASAQAGAPRTWSPGIAALLSLVIPGAGQMYRGHVGAGLLWFVFVIGGYAMFIFPGLILHIVCIVAAASGEDK